MISKLKQLRQNCKLTQQEAADLMKVSVRSYKTYENDPSKEKTLKYQYMLEQLEKLNFIDEEHGILKIDTIVEICSQVFDKYSVDYCYLFGSYASGQAKDTSDVDLFISTELTGLIFFELVENLREGLRKRVDLVALQQSDNNLDLINEILKKGIRIYVKP